MHSESGLSEISFSERLRAFTESRWEALSEPQKVLAKKFWGILTYKWRWQIAMNIPYLILFLLDRTIPSVHKFDMAILHSITSRIPLPEFLASYF